MAGRVDAKQIEKVVALFPEIELVYLFGSQATGNVGPLSDYDFGVLVKVKDRGELPILRARIAHELVKAVGVDRVDVVMLNDAPIELAYAVIAQGEVLYSRDETTRVDYEARVMGLYGDYLPVLRAQRQDIIRAGRRGGEHADRVQRYREALRRTERAIGEIRSSREETSR